VFGIDSSELAIIALVALLVIGPKDLPRVMRMVGQWMAKGRAMSRHVRAGFDTMMREAELDEMQKAWAAQNEAIMKATALPDPIANSMAGIDPASWTLPDPMAADTPALPPPAESIPAAATAAEPPPKKPRAPRKKKPADGAITAPETPTIQ
jgi:sec-independent protein translocase protein TatB